MDRCELSAARNRARPVAAASEGGSRVNRPPWWVRLTYSIEFLLVLLVLLSWGIAALILVAIG